MPAARIEGLIAAHIPRIHIRDVAEVYQGKWWDYRRLSPGHSFMLFAHVYYKFFAIAGRKFLNERSNGKKNLNGILGAGLMRASADAIWDRDKRHITSMWKAMLTADALGVPYDRYCQIAFQISFDTAWTHLPRPNQLYSPKLGAQVVSRWDEMREERLVNARHPLFRLSNYCDLPVQNEYQAWLVEELKNLSAPLHSIAEVVYRNPQLPETMIEPHFPKPLLNRARLLVS